MANIQTLGDNAIYVKFPGATGVPTPTSGNIFAPGTFPSEGYKELRTIKDSTGRVIWAHKWELMVNPRTGGSVSCSPSRRVKDGNTIIATATPPDGYKFNRWVYATPQKSTITTSGNTLTAVMKEHLVITPEFVVLPPYIVLACGRISGSGTLTNNVYSHDNMVTFNYDNFDLDTTDDKVGICGSDVGYSSGIFVKSVYGTDETGKKKGTILYSSRYYKEVNGVLILYNTPEGNDLINYGKKWKEAESFSISGNYDNDYEYISKAIAICGGMYNGQPRFVCACSPEDAGDTAGQFVGPWYSDDGKYWDRGVNRSGREFTRLDEFTHCGYGMVTRGTTTTDIFVVTSTCGGGDAFISYSGGVQFEEVIDRSSDSYNNGGDMFCGCVVKNEVNGVRADSMSVLWCNAADSSCGEKDSEGYWLDTVNLFVFTEKGSGNSGNWVLKKPKDAGDGFPLCGPFDGQRMRMAHLNGITIIVAGSYMWFTTNTDMTDVSQACWIRYYYKFRSNGETSEYGATGTYYIVRDLISNGRVFIAITSRGTTSGSSQVWTCEPRITYIETADSSVKRDKTYFTKDDSGQYIPVPASTKRSFVNGVTYYEAILPWTCVRNEKDITGKPTISLASGIAASNEPM